MDIPRRSSWRVLSDQEAGPSGLRQLGHLPCRPYVHIRGAVVQTRVTSSLFSGNMIVTLNANWNSKFCGPIWGTFVLTLDTGGVWEGTWTGKRALVAGGWSASLVAEGYGTGPGIDGMHMKETETAVSTTPIPFPYTGSVSGYIF